MCQYQCRDGNYKQKPTMKRKDFSTNQCQQKRFRQVCSLVFSIQVTVRPPILHASISRFPHHLVPALPTQNYYLSNKSWSINNKTKYFTNILTSQWKCQSMSTWSMYMKFWSSIRSVLCDQISYYWISHLLNCIIVMKK